MRAALLALLLLAAPAGAALTPAELEGAASAPPPGARLPAALRFADQDGRATTLGKAAAGRPVVLLFADYTCRQLCGVGLTLTAGALHDAGLIPGRDYRLIVLGFDPKDKAADARRMRDTHLAALPAERAAATLLTGDAANVRAAAKALGYRFVYDPAADQFAHDAALYVFAADGALNAVLAETAAPPPMLRAALTAPAPRLSFAERAIALCHGFATAHGIYGAPAVLALRIGGALVVAALVLGIALLARRGRAARC